MTTTLTKDLQTLITTLTTIQSGLTKVNVTSCIVSENNKNKDHEHENKKEHKSEIYCTCEGIKEYCPWCSVLSPTSSQDEYDPEHPHYDQYKTKHKHDSGNIE
jgi:hypothetical protein